MDLPKTMYQDNLDVLILLSKHATEKAVTAKELSAHSDPKLAPADIAKIATSVCKQGWAVLKPGGKYLANQATLDIAQAEWRPKKSTPADKNRMAMIWALAGGMIAASNVR